MANNEEIIYVNMNTDGMKTATEELAKELLVLRLAFGKLKASVKRAVAPLGVVFIPVVQKAVWAATRLTNAIGKVTTALFWQGDAADDAAKKQNTLAKANDTVRRSLADFDELDRLEILDSELDVSGDVGAMTPKLQAVVDKILSLVAPLREINLDPAVAAFTKFRESVAPISEALFAGLEWAWHNLLVPLAGWSAEHLLPAFLDVLATSMGTLNTVITTLKPVAEWLLQNFLRPLAQWAGEKILASLQELKARLEGIGLWVSYNQGFLQKYAALNGAFRITNGIMSVFNGLTEKGTGLLSGFGNGINGLQNPLSSITGKMHLLNGVITTLKVKWMLMEDSASMSIKAIGGMWGMVGDSLKENLFSPMLDRIKNAFNDTANTMNGLLSGVTAAANSIIQGVNGSVGAGLISGSELALKNILGTPNIPHLAKGAVLPANKPFMAVLGDQKHGTNVEAPVDTIKQALAEVLNQQGETVVSVNFGGDLAQLARILKPVIDTETRRRGNSLATGGVF